MDKKIIKFADTDIEKNEFHQHKSPILINDIYINEIVSNKLPFGKQDLKKSLKNDLCAYSFQK